MASDSMTGDNMVSDDMTSDNMKSDSMAGDSVVKSRLEPFEPSDLTVCEPLKPNDLTVRERLTVRELERLLFASFPAADATREDRIGLLVGDPDAKVTSIALALDATVDTIEVAYAYGCNVLVTHHPVFWISPMLFLREPGVQSANGAAEAAAAAIYRAAEKGVALIAMHTNLDCAPAAAGMLLDPVGYEYRAPLLPPADYGDGSASRPAANPQKPIAECGVVVGGEPIVGLGQIGAPRRVGKTREAKPATLEELAQRYLEAFGAVAKVWGDPSTPIEVLATCSGDGGAMVKAVIASDADCFVTGEVRYHEALELAAAGIALIELGHDRSELPYRYYLRDSLLAARIAADRIHVIEPLVFWWQLMAQPERNMDD